MQKKWYDQLTNSITQLSAIVNAEVTTRIDNPQAMANNMAQQFKIFQHEVRVRLGNIQEAVAHMNDPEPPVLDQLITAADVMAALSKLNPEDDVFVRYVDIEGYNIRTRLMGPLVPNDEGGGYMFETL